MPSSFPQLAILFVASFSLHTCWSHDGEKRAPLSVNQPISLLSDLMEDRKSQHNPLLRLGKRGDEEDMGVDVEESEEEANYPTHKRAHLSVNQPLSVLSDFYNSERQKGNPLLALGKRTEKRAALSINQPLSVLSDMYEGGERQRNPLLALGKRSYQRKGEKRAALSVNGAMDALSNMYNAGQDQPRNRLLALGKRSRLSVTQPLTVLTDMVQRRRVGPIDNPLQRIGRGISKRNSDFMDYMDAPRYYKRASLSVNQPLDVLSSMYNSHQDNRNPLMALGKRAPLSINQPMSVLSGILDSPQPGRNPLVRLGKRKSLSVNQPLQVLSEMYGSEGGYRKDNPLIALGKRTPLSVNSAINALSDLLNDEQHPNRLLSLG